MGRGWVRRDEEGGAEGRGSTDALRLALLGLASAAEPPSSETE